MRAAARLRLQPRATTTAILDEQAADVGLGAEARTGFQVPWKANAGASVSAMPRRRNIELASGAWRARSPARSRLVDGETVVLARDHHVAAVEVDDQVVRAVMAELHLHRLRAAGRPSSWWPRQMPNSGGAARTNSPLAAIA